MKVFLKPGELYIGKEPAVISTILGSCLSITMFNARLGVGGICHALFPNDFKQKNGNEFHYVDGSISYMLNEFEKIGIKRNEIEVKVFGGASINITAHKKTVGQANIEAAINIISGNDLKVLTCDFGGTLGRKIMFYTDTGRVLLKKLEKPKGASWIG
jgi:chemotaxis protein CheD